MKNFMTLLTFNYHTSLHFTYIFVLQFQKTKRMSLLVICFLRVSNFSLKIFYTEEKAEMMKDLNTKYRFLNVSIMQVIQSKGAKKSLNNIGNSLKLKIIFKQ